MRTKAFIILAAVCAYAPAFAANETDEDKVICKRDREAELGTRMRAPKTCMKKSEWRALEAQNARALRQFGEGGRPLPAPQPVGSK